MTKNTPPEPPNRPQPPELKSPLNCLLTTALTRRRVVEGGYPKLAAEITAAYEANLADTADTDEANTTETTQLINRQKLARLAEGDRNVSLSIRELEGLNFYLEPFGFGLRDNPLFSLSTPLQALATSKQATFCLGAKMGAEGSTVSHLDMMAMVQIQRSINKLGYALPIDIFDVHGTVRTPGRGRRPWTRVLERQGPSVVCIASPRANQATEVALRDMLSIKTGPTPWNKLPFYFVWKGVGGINKQESHLARPVAEIKREKKGQPEFDKLIEHVTNNKGWGLVVGDQVFCSDHLTQKKDGKHKLLKTATSHAVIAVQRQPEGQIWMVVAGLNGTGTYLAASRLHEMRGEVPPLGDPNQHAVLWSVVEGDVTMDSMIGKGELPTLEDAAFVVPPRLWDPKKKIPLT